MRFYCNDCEEEIEEFEDVDAEVSWDGADLYETRRGLCPKCEKYYTWKARYEFTGYYDFEEEG